MHLFQWASVGASLEAFKKLRQSHIKSFATFAGPSTSGGGSTQAQLPAPAMPLATDTFVRSGQS